MTTTKQDSTLTLEYQGDNDGDFAGLLLRALDGFTVDIELANGLIYEAVMLDVDGDCVRLYCDPDNSGIADRFVAAFDPSTLAVTKIVVL